MFPSDIGEAKEYSYKKIAAICVKCGTNYKKNVTIQKYCRECGEIESKERYLRRKNDRIKRQNSPAL
jgi:predicted  nucleic acid-binding Zn-ribbon protein